jgi:hypothetical protein
MASVGTPILNQTVTAEIDEVQLPDGRYFHTAQLFELGEWDWNNAKPAVSAISQNPLQKTDPE